MSPMSVELPLRVLVVDDEPLINATLCRQVQRMGCELVGAAYDGPEAIEQACALHPTVVLMDLQMTDPHTGREDPTAGLRAVRTLQEVCPVAVVLVTAHESHDLVQWARQVGVGAYLVKPVSEYDLERAMVIALARFEEKVALQQANDNLKQVNLKLIDEIQERQRVESTLIRRDALLEAISLAAQHLMQVPHWRDSFNALLARLGQAARAHRAYLFENLRDPDGTMYTRLQFEWSAPGIPSQMDNPLLVRTDLDAPAFSHWAAALSRGDVITRLVKNLPELEQKALLPQKIQSIVVVPIFVQQQWWGFLGFDDCGSERLWSNAEVNALKVLAGLVGGAIERQQASDSLRRRADEMDALYAISLEINSQHDLNLLLQDIVVRLCQLVGARIGGLYLMETQQKLLRLAVTHNFVKYSVGTTLQMGEGLAGLVAQTGEMRMVDDYRHWPGRAEAYAEYNFQRTLAVPLKRGAEILGVINITDDQHSGPYSPEAIRLAQLFADQAAIALENARLMQLAADELAERTRTAERLQYRLDIEDLTTRISRQFINVPAARLEEELVGALEGICRFAGARACFLYLFAAQGDAVESAYTWLQPDQRTSELPMLNRSLADHTWAMQLLQSQKSLYIASLNEMPPEAAAARALWARLGVAGLVAVPLMLENTLAGCLGLSFAQPIDTEQDQILLLLRMVSEVFFNALERKRADEALHFISTHDALTGLYNYAYFETELQRLQNGRSFPVTVMMGDVDNLKEVNDTYGHAAGDDHLRRVAQLLRNIFRTEDVVSRLGGDEFGVLLPNTDTEAGEQALQRLRAEMEEYNQHHPDQPPLNVSFGRATVQQGQNLSAGFKLADARMYREKRQRKKKTH